MSKLPLIARVLLGLPFVVFGLNGFLHFIPQPPMTGTAAELMGAMHASGYMLPLLFLTQLVGGLLVLSGRLTPLGLVLLAPILVQIIAFHAVLAPAGIGMGIFLTLIEIYLAWAYRDCFRPMFDAHPTR